MRDEISSAPADSPLRLAQRMLARIRTTVRLSLLVPIPIIAAATIGLLRLSHDWFQDPFLTLFLGLIFVIFVTGQAIAFTQLLRMLPSLRSAERTLAALMDAGDDPDLQSLRWKLRENVPAGHLRDLVLRWVDLGLRENAAGHEVLLEDSLERRSIHDNNTLSLHISINRTTLKLGFLGTLIGIILTFPPMKRAVLGLADSEGELSFIKDIALAIDGDQYAILSTLVATGLSILVEFLTIQLLERILLSFDVVQSHVNDWNIVVLQPSVRRHHGTDGRAEELERSQGRMELALIHAQQALERHLEQLTGAMRTAGAQLDQVVHLQEAVGKRLEDLAGYEKLAIAMLQSQQGLDNHLASLSESLRTAASQLGQVSQVQTLVGKRVTELSEYEKQYRGFLTSKQQAAVPANLRGEH